jgi:hypothetical protein
MKIRQEVFDTYWRFAALRQNVFFSRIKKLPSPWINDEIINTFKFCNTYRASDRVSQYLIQNVIYKGSQNEEEVIFRILLFKIFNKIETWQYLEQSLGGIEVAKFDFGKYSKLLQEAMASGETIYTSAYMSCATKAFGYERKHENHLALIEQMVQKDHIAQKILNARSLKEVFLVLVSYPLIGQFMAYQLAIDLNYSEVIDFSENSFTVAGPGAERGIKKCFVDTEGKSNEYIIRWMTENQEREFERLGINFPSLWGRPLHYIDCQGLFCETDKYSREAFPELKSNRKRIKSKFHPNSKDIDYFYPPKWKINDKVAADINFYKSVPTDPSSTYLQLPLGL